MRFFAKVHYTALNRESDIIDFPLEDVDFMCFFCSKYTSILKKDFKEGMFIDCKHCRKNICIITKVYKRKKKTKKRKTKKFKKTLDK